MALIVTAAERSDVRGLLSVVVLTIDAVGLQTGALAAGGLMTTMLGHSQLDVFDMPFDTLTLTLKHNYTPLSSVRCLETRPRLVLK